MHPITIAKVNRFPLYHNIARTIFICSQKKAQFSQTFHLFQVVGVQLFHFLSLYKPHTYPPSFLVLFQLIRFHQFLLSKCFCIHDVLSQTNRHQSLSLLRLIFIHFVSASSNPSLFVKVFLFLSFFLLLVVFFSALMLCKPGFYFLFGNNVSFKAVSGERKAVTPEIVAGWNETTPPTFLSNYGLENIYNADEFGLFYQYLPDQSHQLKTEMFRW